MHEVFVIEVLYLVKIFNAHGFTQKINLFQWLLGV
jgi:hypothetical protein